MYLAVTISSLLALWKNANRLQQRDRELDSESKNLFWMNEATLAGLCGLVVCSLFLSLQLFEIYYCLFFMVNALTYQIGKLNAIAETGDGGPSKLCAT